MTNMFILSKQGCRDELVGVEDMVEQQGIAKADAWGNMSKMCLLFPGTLFLMLS